MFLAIDHIPSGETFLLRRIAPKENKTAREYATEWADSYFDGYAPKLSFSETGSYIPTGCGEYACEIRRTKKADSSCWEREDFFIQLESE